MSIDLKGAKLRACEEVIERGQQTFIQVGQALARIRDERLYREKGYVNFDAYCQERWGMQKSYASKLISGSLIGQEFPVGNQRQAYELDRVPDSQRAEVMARAQQVAEEREQPVTAAVIREVATQDAEPRKKCSHCAMHCPSSW